jgi:hypothetical protein
MVAPFLPADIDENISEMGAPIELEQFIRDMAKSMGYVRLRESVRDRVLRDIHQRVQFGQLVVENGLVWVRKPVDPSSLAQRIRGK